MVRANRGKFDGGHAILIRCVDVEVSPKIVSFFSLFLKKYLRDVNDGPPFESVLVLKRPYTCMTSTPACPLGFCDGWFALATHSGVRG